MSSWEVRAYSNEELMESAIVALPADHVSEGIPYRRPGGRKDWFSVARVPDGTVVDGVDVGGYEFYPNFVNKSPEDGMLEAPVPRNRELWLRKPLYGPDGRFAIDAKGHRARETVKADPDRLARAVAEALGRAPAVKVVGGRGLGERAAQARAASGALGRAAGPASARARAEALG